MQLNIHFIQTPTKNEMNIINETFQFKSPHAQKKQKQPIPQSLLVKAYPSNFGLPKERRCMIDYFNLNPPHKYRHYLLIENAECPRDCCTGPVERERER
jgi:hypothetical protein